MMSEFASYDGTRLAYRRVGEGRLLLCVPGGPGRASEYLEDLGGLHRDRTLVLLDNRGTGKSATPSDPETLRFDRLAGDLEALRVHLGEERVDVLAHSAGAVVAQVWAASHPDRVRNLVLVTPSDLLQGGTREDLDSIRAARKGEPWYEDAIEAVHALAITPSDRAQPLWRRVRPFFYGNWDERTRTHAMSVETQSNAVAERGWGEGAADVELESILSGLAQVEAPVLVVGGEHDAITGLLSVKGVARSFPNARMHVVSGAGHFPWIDQPGPFADAVRAFLAGAGRA